MKKKKSLMENKRNDEVQRPHTRRNPKRHISLVSFLLYCKMVAICCFIWALGLQLWSDLMLRGPDRLSSCMTQSNENWITCTKVEAWLQSCMCEWITRAAFKGAKDELNFPENQFVVLKRFVLVNGYTFCIKEHPTMYYKTFVW